MKTYFNSQQRKGPKFSSLYFTLSFVIEKNSMTSHQALGNLNKNPKNKSRNHCMSVWFPRISIVKTFLVLVARF